MSEPPVLVKIDELEKSLFITVNDTPKIGDRVLMEDNETSTIDTDEHVVLAIMYKQRVIIPYIPPHTKT